MTTTTEDEALEIVRRIDDLTQELRVLYRRRNDMFQALLDEGHTMRDVARMFDVSAAAVGQALGHYPRKPTAKG